MAGEEEMATRPTNARRRRRPCADAGTRAGRASIAAAACVAYCNTLQRSLGAHGQQRAYARAAPAPAPTPCAVCGAATTGRMHVGCAVSPWVPCCACHLRAKNLR